MTMLPTATPPELTTSPPNGPRSSYNRACESCRESKVRCVTENLAADGKCKRCFTSGRTCVFAIIAPKKPRLRTDARVKDLEKEINAMKLLLHSRQTIQSTPLASEIRLATSSSLCKSTPFVKVPQYHSSHTPLISHPGDIQKVFRDPRSDDLGNSYLDSSSTPHTQDVIEAGVVSAEMAEYLFNQFRDECAPQYPIVYLLGNATIEQLRSKQPSLFLSVLAAASSAQGQLFEKLHTHSMRSLLERVVLHGTKSHELVQAVLLTESWYLPPRNMENVNYYQWIQIAASMAMDIGLFTPRSRESRESTIDLPDRSQSKNENFEIPIEECRTVLATYLICSSVAVSHRRRNSLEFTPYVQECHARLKHSPIFNDKQLAAWFELQKISEDVANTFTGSNTDSQTFVADRLMQFEIRRLQTRFVEWKETLAEGILTGSLSVHFYYTLSKLYELAIHVNHDLEDLSSAHLSQAPEAMISSTMLNAPYIRATFSLLAAAHSTIDSFLEIRPSTLRLCPVVTYARICHQMKLLLKLHLTILQPIHELTSVLGPDDVKFASYLGRVQDHLAQARGDMNCKVPAKIFEIISKFEEVSQRVATERMRCSAQQGEANEEALQLEMNWDITDGSWGDLNNFGPIEDLNSFDFGDFSKVETLVNVDLPPQRRQVAFSGITYQRNLQAYSIAGDGLSLFGLDQPFVHDADFLLNLGSPKT